MRIGLVIQPFTAENLQLAAQIGVEDVVYYDMTQMPTDPAALREVKQRAEGVGLRMSVVEGGPPTTRIILRKDGADEQIENWKRCLDAMGKAGFDTLCYDWMPPQQGVVRTTYRHAVRGGASVSAFDLSKYDNDARTDEGDTTDETMWDDLDWFLARVLPAAEDAGVRLAMHPDDPPLSPMQGLARIMRSPDAFARMFEMQPSPANAMTFCQGCFSEMCVDIPATVKRFADRIAFVHFRDVAGEAGNFYETFHDEGKTDMAAAMNAYLDAGLDVVIRPDHVPIVAGVDPAEAEEGYTMRGRLFAVGYMRGLMHSRGKVSDSS